MTEETEIMNCEMHGDYEAKVVAVLTRKIYSKCPECQIEENKAKAEQDAIELERKAQEAAKAKRDRLLRNGLMARYLGIELSDIEPTEEQKKAYDACLIFVAKFEEMCESGKTLILCGTVGTGKTMFAHAVLQSLDFGCYLRAIDISRMVRDCYSKNESEFDLIDSLAFTRLLVIDEIGVQQDTKHETLLITDLIDRRYGNLLPTIICSNLNKEKLKEVFGERSWDRLMQNGSIIPIVGKSLRSN